MARNEFYKFNEHTTQLILAHRLKIQVCVTKFSTPLEAEDFLQ